MQETEKVELVPGASPDPSSAHHAPVKSTTDARAGVTLGRMRWVLSISLLAVIAALSIVWWSAHSP